MFFLYKAIGINFFIERKHFRTMDWSFDEVIRVCWDGEAYRLLSVSQHALERECLRVDALGMLAQTPHPRCWGHPLTHPHISTDYCESQPELITPPFDKEEKALAFLHQLHQFLYSHLEDEILWPSSAPCLLPDEERIPLAQYGASEEGLKKTLYRRGLGYRYGRKMQTLSGIHYNFSLSEAFWEFLAAHFSAGNDNIAFIGESYLHLVRNFLRLVWLNTYLFGASPVADSSYFSDEHHGLENLDETTCGSEYATSIRMSHLGYGGKDQTSCTIAFNDLSGYIDDLHYAVTMPNPEFAKIGVCKRGEQCQLNDHFLQTTSEHYSLIRPKAHVRGKESVIQALKRRGIAYVEARAIDINSFSADGLELDQLLFLHTFLLYCLFKESPPIVSQEFQEVTHNQERAALQGRDPQLILKRDGQNIVLGRWGGEVLREMQRVADLLDAAYGESRYSESLHRQVDKLSNPDRTPSGRIFRILRKNGLSFQQFGRHWARQHRAAFQAENFSPDVLERFRLLAETSLKQTEGGASASSDYSFRWPNVNEKAIIPPTIGAIS